VDAYREFLDWAMWPVWLRRRDQRNARLFKVG
jgi:hypothetical protein